MKVNIYVMMFFKSPKAAARAEIYEYFLFEYINVYIRGHITVLLCVSIDKMYV